MSELPQSVFTKPPAKLNLFLELLGRRPDGFHELDTIMVAIDLCDEMYISRTKTPQIELQVDWLPSRQTVASRLDVDMDSSLLAIPTDDQNLVCKALAAFRDRFDVAGGFDCRLWKRIPAGAGMGGASSDAASSLLCAAKLAGVDATHPGIQEIASSLGSDIPFFFGAVGQDGEYCPIHAARATGRGEKIDPVSVECQLFFVLVYPNDSLSTAAVYSESVLPERPVGSESMIDGLATGNLRKIQDSLTNRLQAPAKKILPRIDEILESMWRSGLQACQLTGSGSTCFAIADSKSQAQQCALRLQAMLEPGAFVAVTQTTRVAALTQTVVEEW